MEAENGRRILYIDGLNWLDSFWNTEGVMRDDPWQAFQNCDEAVGRFIAAARQSNVEVVVVGNLEGERYDISKWKKRREKEIAMERRNLCLKSGTMLFESFQEHGVRVTNPVQGAEVDDVLAALAVATSGIVLRRANQRFVCDVPISVCTGFFIHEGKLELESLTTSDILWNCSVGKKSRKVELNFAKAALHDEQIDRRFGEAPWHTYGKFKPSWAGGKIKRGTSSSSDKRMGNLHVLSRPLRAAVYAILGEESATELIPEWSKKKKKVVWPETRVDSDPALIPLLKQPEAVVAWLVERDTPVLELEPWRAMERFFNICALAAELVVVSSQGAWTMRKCMELFHKQVHTYQPVRAPSSRTLDSQARIGVGAQVYGHHAQNQDSDKQVADHQIVLRRKLILKPRSESAETDKITGDASRVRESIFGLGRPREQVLKERGAENK